MMKRRKFLKLLGWSPLVFLVPKVFSEEKLSSEPAITKSIAVCDSDGGFIVQRDLARKIIAKTYNIPKSYLK